MRVLTGFLIDGKSSGIDKYIQNVIDAVYNTDIIMDFLTISINEDLKKLCVNKKIKIFEIPPLKKPLKQYLEIKKIITEQQYDAVYLNISESFNCILALAANKCGVKKIIVHSHSSGAGGRSFFIRGIRSALNYCFKQVLGHTGTDFYACSRMAGEWLYPKKIVDSASFRIINNTVDIPRYTFNSLTRTRIRAKLGIDNKVVIGHVGRYCYAKNNLFLLDILEELRKSVPNVLLLAVGDGPDWKKTKEEANKRQLKNHVMFLGVRTDVPELLQAMDLFILPSRFEGQPIAAIEAQIAGLKVILSDTITMDAQLSEYCLWENIQKGAAEWARKVVDNLNYKRLIIKQEDSLVRKFDSKFQSDEINKIFKRTK